LGLKTGTVGRSQFSVCYTGKISKSAGFQVDPSADKLGLTQAFILPLLSKPAHPQLPRRRLAAFCASIP
jgi:hypothetical protein